MVFYRKYRPQSIDDLDNAAVRKTLSSVLKNSSTHAFLFTGPKGLGKTSTARIIAKVVNCENRKKDEIEPCNKCAQCVSITNGTNLDVLEIDAASNRGIDEIRDLKEKIRLSPVSAKIKVYIIDEVHMLTTEAFNALLKTLEEPPSHAMFILCTTEPHKVPATIISRCFHLSFKPATEEELVRSFSRIVKAETIDITEEALKFIASMSDRGFRDGTKILEEISSLAEGKKIDKAFIEENYKTSAIGNLMQPLLKALKKKDTKESLQVIEQLVTQGIDVKYFLQQLIETLHGLMLVEITVNDQPASSAFTLEEIRILFALLSQANIEMKTTVLPQLPLELAIIEYCQIDTVIPSDQGESRNLSQQIQKDPSTSVGMTKEGVSVTSLRKQVGTIKKIQALYGTQKKDEDKAEPAVKTSTVELMHASPNGDVTAEWLEHFWRNLINEIKNYNHTVAGLLRGCTIKQYDKKTLIIETTYKFHKEKLSEIKTLQALEAVCKLLTGKMIEVKVELKA